MSAPLPPGTVITFYSYKGGTGRSMALANVGCLLAQRQTQAGGRGVLLVDWDLEAPGLHRFFRHRFQRTLGTGDESSDTLDRYPGLIDLFCQLQKIAADLPEGQTEISSDEERKLRAHLSLQEFVLETDIDSLHLLKAGRFDNEYRTLVNTFGWEALYNRSSWLIPWFAGWLAESYEYVLIDSRTGITDTSGICTMLLPEKLAVVFTPNLQSTGGAIEQIETATRYRRQSDDLRPLMVYPLPSRIESTLPKLSAHWRYDAKCGYQPRFEALFQRVYGLSRCDLTDYFDEILVAQIPDYAYGEEIAVLVERGADKYSLTKSYAAFTDWLLGEASPWENPALEPARLAAHETLRRAYSFMSQLSPEETEKVRRLLSRLVRVTAGPESGIDSLRRARRNELNGPLIEQMIAADVVRLVPTGGESSEPALELADLALITEWAPLRDWIEKDREFLLWRQRLDDSIEPWESSGRESGFLLSKSALAQAQQMVSQRAVDLNEREIAYIEESGLADQRMKQEEEELREREAAALRQARLTIKSVFSAVLAAVLFVLAVLVWSRFNAKAFTSINAITFSDPQHGWIIGSDTNRQDVLLATDDGGKTWEKTHSDFGIVGPNAVRFVDPKHGWLVGYDGIAASTDGGKTWKTQLEGLSFKSLQFIGPSKGWAVEEDAGVYRTIDGGLHWIKEVMDDLPPRLSSVHFVDTAVGWAVGEGGMVMTTEDGGKTWRQQAFKDRGHLRSVFFLDRRTGWIAGERGIFRTIDGGKTWRLAEYPSGALLSFVFFTDPRAGWVVSNYLYATTDGGETWTMQNIPGMDLYLGMSIWFVDSQKGWLGTSDGHVFSTENGGKTWTERSKSL